MKYRWKIFIANLEPVIGAEQGRKRPVLVISEEEMNQILPVVNVLPITSRKKGRKIYPNEVLIPQGMHGLTNESIVLCYQIRTLEKKRLEVELGEIKNEIIKETIIEALSFQLGIFKSFMIDNAENLTEASENEKTK